MKAEPLQQKNKLMKRFLLYSFQNSDHLEKPEPVLGGGIFPSSAHRLPLAHLLCDGRGHHWVIKCVLRLKTHHTDEGF